MNEQAISFHQTAFNLDEFTNSFSHLKQHQKKKKERNKAKQINEI